MSRIIELKNALQNIGDELRQKTSNLIVKASDPNVASSEIKKLKNETEALTDKFEILKAEYEKVEGEGIEKVKNQSTNNIVDESTLIKVKNYKTIKEFRNAFAPKNENLEFGKFIKGALFNDWKGAEKENRSFQNKVDGTVLLPHSIASDVIYKASNTSVLLNNCNILPMEEGSITIGKIKENVSLDFKKKGEEGKESGLGLEGVVLNAKTLYAWIEISEEDLHDIANLDAIVSNAFGGAVGEALDKAFLYNQTTDPSKADYYPKGVLDNIGIKKVQVSKVDYDMIGKACLSISENNGEPNTVALNPNEFYNLQMLKDANGQYIQAPTFWNDLTRIKSNAIKQNDGIVFDSNQIVIGIRKEMDIKVMDNLKNGTVLLRCMFRADVAPARENHICKIEVKIS